MVMQININGLNNDIPEGMTVAELIDFLGLTGKRIAVEINKNLVPRSRFSSQHIMEHDQIEIIHAVGGG